MTVALIAETGVRIVDIPFLLPELRFPLTDVPARIRVWLAQEGQYVPAYRRFVRMDEHTYVEKD